MLFRKETDRIYPDIPFVIGGDAPAMLAPIFGEDVFAFERELARNASEGPRPSGAP